MSEDTQALVERVRRGFAEYDDDTEMVVDEASSALDSLTAALERAERERDEYRHRWECADTPLMRDVMADRDAAEARAQKAEAERDAALKENFLLGASLVDQSDKLLKAEAVVEAARALLPGPYVSDEGPALVPMERVIPFVAALTAYDKENT